MSLWTWVKDKAFSFEVGAAGVTDLVAGTDYTATVLSHAAPLQEEAATYEVAKRQVDEGLLERAAEKTKEQVKKAVNDAAEALPSVDVPWWIWAGLGTLGAVTVLASFGYAVRAVRSVAP